MSTSSKAIRALVMAVCMALAAAACGGGESSDTTAPTSGDTGTTSGGTDSTTAADSDLAGTTLTFWRIESEAEGLTDLYEEFQEETGIELEMVLFPSDGFEDAVQTRWATGERPDILGWHAGWSNLVALNPSENLRDISDEPFIDTFVPGLLDNAGSVDGVNYGIVMTAPLGFGMYYNKEIFAELGLELPQTEDELIQVCADIRAADPTLIPAFEAGGSGWPPLVTLGSAMSDGMADGFLDAIGTREARLDDPDGAWLAGLQSYKHLQDAGCFNDDIVTAEYEDSYSALMEGEAAMVSQHSLIAVDAADVYGADEVNRIMGFFPWSINRAIVPLAYAPEGTYYVPITGDEKREAAAIEFLRFMTGPAYGEMIAEYGLVPTIQDVPVPDDVVQPLADVQEAINEYGGTATALDYLVGPDFITMTGQLITGQATPEEIATDIQQQADQGARAAGLQGWDE